MSDLKPIGSEKLPLDDKLKRIMEIANYGITKKTPEKKDPTSTVAFLKECSNGVYGVVRERDGYYVKYGLNESSLQYIGGMQMKNKNRFGSYAEAVKRLELISRPLTEQEKKYILRNSDAVSEDPAPSPAMDDTDDGLPPSEDTPPPADDAGMGDEPPADDAGMDAPVDDVPAPEGDGMDGEAPLHMKAIQKLTGKLGQRLRQFSEDLKGDDIKYVINSVLAAVDLTKLEDADKEEIVSKFEDDMYDEPSGLDQGDVDTTDTEFGGDDAGMGDEPPADDAGMDAPPSDEEMGEDYDDIFEAFAGFQNSLFEDKSGERQKVPVKKLPKPANPSKNKEVHEEADIEESEEMKDFKNEVPKKDKVKKVPVKK